MIGRIGLVALGTLLVGIGVVGVFLPILPTTPFLLLAAACYLRGSERLYAWLTAHRLLGRYIRYYRDGQGIPLRAKIVMVAVLWVTIGTSAVFFVGLTAVRVLLVLIALGVSAYILTRKTGGRS